MSHIMTSTYDEIKTYFANSQDIVVNSGKGAQGMKIGREMFVMFYKGKLIVKLDPSRVTELIKKGIGNPFDPGTGKTMKDRMIVDQSQKASWIDLCKESAEYVRK